MNTRARSLPSRLMALGALVVSAALVLTACAPAATLEGPSAEAQAVLESAGVAGVSGEEAIRVLDEMPLAERPTNLFGSILPEVLQLTVIDGAGGEETIELPLPEDQFYLSIAPFATQTHDCFYHSLTTCVGELGNETVNLTVVDAASGAEVSSDTVTTYDNGFVGLWLPRGGDYEITVDAAHGTGSVLVGTGGEDATCITTLQLS